MRCAAECLLCNLVNPTLTDMAAKRDHLTEQSGLPARGYLSSVNVILCSGGQHCTCWNASVVVIGAYQLWGILASDLIDRCYSTRLLYKVTSSMYILEIGRQSNFDFNLNIAFHVLFRISKSILQSVEYHRLFSPLSVIWFSKQIHSPTYFPVTYSRTYHPPLTSHLY